MRLQVEDEYGIHESDPDIIDVSLAVEGFCPYRSHTTWGEDVSTLEPQPLTINADGSVTCPFPSGLEREPVTMRFHWSEEE